MKVTATALPEVLLLEPPVFSDARGNFIEAFKQREFEAAVGQAVQFVQDNQSRSVRGVLRGLHYQLPPHAQGKLVRVSAGRVFDVALDVRRGSARFGQWMGCELSSENHHQLWIPPGFAHGFLVLSDSADVQYKVSRYYDAKAERAVRWDDPALAIAWPSLACALEVSVKDRSAPTLAQQAEQVDLFAW